MYVPRHKYFRSKGANEVRPDFAGDVVLSPL